MKPIRLGSRQLAAMLVILPAVLASTGVAAADTTPGTLTIVVSPSGSDTAPGTAARPLRTLAAAQQRARLAAQSGDVTVLLRDGTYQQDAPLVFTAQDSGRPGHPVTWTAAPGEHPVVSGGIRVTAWSRQDPEKNIYVASVPVGVDSRQLYSNDDAVPRASMTISRSDVTVTTTGLTINNPNLDYLASLPEQSRIEVESQDSFTDRYAPVQSINGTTITMQQPGWQNNNWGYDTLAHPFAGGRLLLENSYSFLQPGQWYLDPSAGRLYYRARGNEDPNGGHFVLPRLQSLVQVAGTYDNPVHDLTFSGIQFSHTTWLSPGTSIGYADQQNGAFIADTFAQPADYLTSCQSGCPLFEAARNSWHQIPAAVQVAASSHITFAGDVFAHLGQVGLGLGNDADAHYSGVGLGVTDTTVHHNLFTDLAGAGVVAGGVQPDAHHPSDERMTLRDITVDNNLVTDVAKDYKEMSGILSTYADHTVISHNEVSNLAYDGIDVGWGWGANDAGGSQDYLNRGLYNYQPIYSTPTTLRDTVVSNNLVHGTKKVFHDGGSIYNLSANPGAEISENYIYDNQHTVGLYLDEGSRYVTLDRNVVQDSGVWVFTNAYGPNNTSDNLIRHTWYNSGFAQLPNAAAHNNQLVDNVKVSGLNWPLDAQRVIYNAGLEPGLRDIDGITMPSPVGTSLDASPTTVAAGGTSTVTLLVVNFSASPARVSLPTDLQVPTGWTVTAQSPLPASLLGNATATARWQVTAPPDAAGTQGQIVQQVSTMQGARSWSSSPQVTISVAATG